MPHPYASGVVAAPAADVWALIRPFDGLPVWHPGIAESQLTEGEEGKVGAVRRLVLGDGRVVVERLVVLDDLERRFTYEFVDNPFGVRRYVSTVRVAEVTDTGAAFVEWWSDYDADEAAEAELDALFRDGVYAAGIAALQGRFG